MLLIQNSTSNIYSQITPKKTVNFKHKLTTVTQPASKITKNNKNKSFLALAGSVVTGIVNFLLPKCTSSDDAYYQSESEFLANFMNDMADRPFENFSKADMEVYDKFSKRYEQLTK